MATIVCGTDFSPAATEATEIARLLAKKYAASLLLIHVVAPLPGESATQADVQESALAAAHSSLKGHAEALRVDGVEVEARVVAGWPDEVLVTAAQGAALLVVGSTGHRRGTHWIIGSTAERVAQRSPVPLLVVRDGESLRSAIQGKRRARVVVGTDLSRASAAVIAWTAKWNELVPSEVRLEYAAYPPAEYDRFGITGPLSRRKAHPVMEEVLTRELSEQTARLGGDASAQFTLTFGRRATELVRVAAEQHADLIVIGAHQRHRLGALWSESVAHGVLHSAASSVVCIPLVSSDPADAALDVPEPARILAATDFSHGGNRAVAWATAIAPAGTEIVVLTVVEHATYEHERLQQLLPVERRRQDVKWRFEVVESKSVAEAICAAAERLDADLIAVGTHGRGEFARLFLGSVAQEVIVRSNRPLLAVREENGG